MAGKFWATLRGRNDAPATTPETVDRHFWDLFDAPPPVGTAAPGTDNSPTGIPDPSPDEELPEFLPDPNPTIVLTKAPFVGVLPQPSPAGDPPAPPSASPAPSNSSEAEPPELSGSTNAPLNEIAVDEALVEPIVGSGSLPDDPSHQENGTTVSQLDTFITELLAIEGATGAAVVDIDSGMALATGGNPGFDLNIAAAGNSNVVRAKLRTMADLNLGGDRIEDVLITLTNQYHIINVLGEGTGNVLFVYLVLNRATANLALARHKLRAASATVSI